MDGPVGPRHSPKGPICKALVDASRLRRTVCGVDDMERIEKIVAGLVAPKRLARLVEEGDN